MLLAVTPVSAEPSPAKLVASTRPVALIPPWEKVTPETVKSLSVKILPETVRSPVTVVSFAANVVRLVAPVTLRPVRVPRVVMFGCWR